MHPTRSQPKQAGALIVFRLAGTAEPRMLICSQHNLSLSIYLVALLICMAVPSDPRTSRSPWRQTGAVAHVDFWEFLRLLTPAARTKDRQARTQGGRRDGLSCRGSKAPPSPALVWDGRYIASRHCVLRSLITVLGGFPSRVVVSITHSSVLRSSYYIPGSVRLSYCM
jgi:hypothetical protein